MGSVDVGVWGRLDGHPQRPFALDRAAAQNSPVQAAKDRGLATVRKSAGLLDVRDCTHAGNLPLDARHEHDQTVGLAGGEDGGAGRFGLDGDWNGHVRQDDAVVKRQQREK